MIIDCHCHAGKGDGLTGPWDTVAPLQHYLRRARAAGITHTVLFPIFHSNYAEANAAVANIVATAPERFLGFACVNPSRDRGHVLALLQDALRLGLRGIKCHRYDGRLTREVCEAARYLQLPLLYDAMGEISLVELVAAEYPGVDFIVPHLGSFSDDWRAHTALIDLLARYDNVYADTAGVRRFDYLVQAVQRAGAHKLLFGSDGPSLHPGLELAKVQSIGLGESDQQLVMAGNLQRLLSKRRAASFAISAA